jgi:hypothetical protein
MTSMVTACSGSVEQTRHQWFWLCRKQENERLCAIWKAPEFKEDPIKAVNTFLARTVPTSGVSPDLQRSDKAKQKRASCM